MSLVLWILIYTAIRALIGILAERFSGSRLSKLVFFPGVLAAIGIRAFTSGLAQAEVKELNPPWVEGPPVVRGAPRLAIVGALLFGLLPPIAAAALPLAATSALGFPPGIDFELPAHDLSQDGVLVFLGTVKDLAMAALAAGRETDWSDARLWLILYLSISFEIYLAPPIGEWGPLAGILFLAWNFLAIIRWLGLTPGFLSRAWFISVFYGDPVWECTARLVASALLVLALSLVLAGTSALARRRAA